MLKKLSPNLMVGDVREAILFYRDQLGFELVMAVPEDQSGVLTALPDGIGLAYAMMKQGGVEIMFQEAGSLAEDIPAFQGRTPGGGVSLYMEVDDVEALYGRIEGRVDVVKPLHTTWYGMREFYIQDPNGYVLGFAQSAG